MRAAMAAAFPRWARDPQIYAVVIASASDRAFCAGGDVREMAEWGKSRRAEARRVAGGRIRAQLAARLLHQAHRLADRRGGDGLRRRHLALRHASRRRRALPVRHARDRHRPVPRRRGGLGLRPPARRDRHVPGADRALHRPGRRLPAGTGDALHSRLAASARSAPRLPMPIPSTRCSTPGTRTPAPGELEPLRAAIARCFSADSVEGILERLQAETGAAAAWAQGVRRGAARRGRRPRSRSPTGMIRVARGLDLRATLAQDLPAGLPVPGGARLLRGRAGAL